MTVTLDLKPIPSGLIYCLSLTFGKKKLPLSRDLRYYLAVFMKSITSLTHRDLDQFSLRFLVGQVDGVKAERIDEYVKRLAEDDFADAAEFALNIPPVTETNTRNEFARALRLNGYEAVYEEKRAEEGIASILGRPSGKWSVVHRTGMLALDRQKETVKSLLTNVGLESVQTDLNLAEQNYVNGNYSQSLVMSKKALEDASDIIAKTLNLERKTLFSSLTQSESATDTLKKIYGYTCKGHSSQAAEYEAIFGYHLAVSAIHFLALFLANIIKSRDKAKTLESYFSERRRN